MKRALIAIAVLGTLFIASCTKTYICECTFLGMTGTTEITSTKKRAAEMCKSYEADYQKTDPNASCTLKKK